MKIYPPRSRHRPRPLRHQPMHLIYRLKGSIPKVAALKLLQWKNGALDELQAEYGLPEKMSGNRLITYVRKQEQIQDVFELRYEQLLGGVKNGPYWLSDERAKRAVIDSWLHLEQAGEVQLFAISVMSNHVHVLLQHPNPDGCTHIDELLLRHKEYTAFRINRLHEQTGRRFWARPFYDRDVRPGRFYHTLWYVINNPLVADLTTDPLNWSGTYVAPTLRQELIADLA